MIFFLFLSLAIKITQLFMSPALYWDQHFVESFDLNSLFKIEQAFKFYFNNESLRVAQILQSEEFQLKMAEIAEVFKEMKDDKVKKGLCKSNGLL